MASNKEMTACVTRVAKAFGCEPEAVTIEFCTRWNWSVTVQTPARDRRIKSHDRTSGIGETLRQAEAEVIRRMPFHSVERAEAAARGERA